MRAFPPILVFLLAIAPALADVDGFTTPSGNIECAAGIGDGIPSDINCRIFERSGPPPVPHLAKCNDALGYEFSMREYGTVTAKCGLPAPPPASRSPDGNAVRYGGAVKYGGIVCRSSTSGLECRNADGHGFFLSRGRQSVF
jgi:hypothetical protein